MSLNIIIAGSRGINDREVLKKAVKSSPFEGNISRITVGMARGVDTMAYNYAMISGYKISEFPAQWDKYGKVAGYYRNKEMGESADGLIAIWDLKSRGTLSMIKIMNELGKPVHLYISE